MNTIPQRWLSLTGISDTLSITPGQVKRLYNQKLLVRIGKDSTSHRYLDPTPEYAERLRLAALMLSKNNAVPINLSMTSMLTVREIAQIMGWSVRYARDILAEKKVPCFKGKNRSALYSITAVRDLLWKRNGRKQAGKIAPMLLSEIINFFRRFQAAEEAIVPTDAQFAEDEQLQKKITWMMRQPQREVMLADFISKMELAKQAIRLSCHIQSDNQP
jgi:hypothetical protein